MNVNNNYNQTNFKAKFLHSNSLHEIANYAVEKGMFAKLYEAQEKISKTAIRTRLKVDIGIIKDKPFITFSRYIPKKDTFIIKNMSDISLAKTITVVGKKEENILDFALKQMLKLGENVPQGKFFRTVLYKVTIPKNYRY